MYATMDAYSAADRLPGLSWGMFVLMCSNRSPTGSAIHVSEKMGPVNSFLEWHVEQTDVKAR
jgi:hypothetical protein